VTTLPSIFPFSKLKLRDQEELMWVGYNPTFHRFTKYGLAISDAAFYVCSGWVFARWRRYPLADIAKVTFTGDRDGRPAIEFQVGTRKVVFRTPFDSHAEEVDFDRGVLSKAVDQLRHGAWHSGSGSASHVDERT
jgi:hypothetical protein